MIEFAAWTFTLYWIHRAAHQVPLLVQWHSCHHTYINQHGSKSCWQLNNLFLFNDNWASTIDLWVTEVLPTVIFAWITGAWWIAVFYYLWAALLQEVLEHRAGLDCYPFTAGEWHLMHHRNPRGNFGLFVPIWDNLFGTEHART